MTEAALRSPQNLVTGMKPDEWFLRTMILERDRRLFVLSGKPDPTPNEPWRICSPKEFRACPVVSDREEARQWRR